MEKNPHDVCMTGKSLAIHMKKKEKIAAVQRIIQFSLFWGRHIGLGAVHKLCRLGRGVAPKTIYYIDLTQ